MKICCKCQCGKPPAQFHRNKNKSDGLQPYCKACSKGFNAASYNKHKPSKRAKLSAARATYNKKLDQAKSAPCLDCGQTHPSWAMHWDHLAEKGEKLFELGAARSSVMSWAKIQAEIDKCDLLCANCHSVRTWARQYPRRYAEFLEENPCYPRSAYLKGLAGAASQSAAA